MTCILEQSYTAQINLPAHAIIFWLRMHPWNNRRMDGVEDVFGSIVRAKQYRMIGGERASSEAYCTHAFCMLNTAPAT